MISASGYLKKAEKRFEVSLLRRKGVLRAGPAFDPHVEIETRDEAFPFFLGKQLPLLRLDQSNVSDLILSFCRGTVNCCGLRLKSGGVFLEGSIDECLFLDDVCDELVASESSPFL